MEGEIADDAAELEMNDMLCYLGGLKQVSRSQLQPPWC